MTWKIKATDPPKLKKPYALRVLWLVASVMLVMALLHLIRIDKLIPIVGETLSEAGAAWFVAFIVIAEVFALPYLLQMRLSPGFRILSGLLVIIVPLGWMCFTIWTLGSSHSTGQFSSYVSTPATWWLIVLNAVWLCASYWALWLSNFDKSFALLRKKR